MVVLNYQVAVGRSSVVDDEFNAAAVPSNAPSPEAMLHAARRAPAPQPTPRFSGNRLVLARLVESLRAPLPGRAVVETQDLNVVAAARHPDRARVDVGGDGELGELLALLDSPGARAIEFREHAMVYGRMNVAAGREGAEERLAAVRNGSFVMYPSPEAGSEDAFEVRFAAPRATRMRYERFLDYGAAELERYISRAVALGDAARLAVERLAEADPIVFWTCILRYKTCFKTLAAASGDREWVDGLRDAVHTAAVKGGQPQRSRRGGPAAENLSFARLLAELTAANRQPLAECGFVAAIPLVFEIGGVPPGPGGVTVEMAEGLRKSRVGKIVQMAMGRDGGGGGGGGGDAGDAGDAGGAGGAAAGRRRDPGLDDIRRTCPGPGADGGVDAAGIDATLVGQCALCAGCGEKEAARGLYRRCGRCRAPHIKYCSRACQGAHWTRGHRQACGGDAEARPDPRAVRAVVFPGDADVKPHAVWIAGGTGDEQMRHIGTALLGCASAADMAVHRVALGDPALVGDVHVFHRRAARGEPNMRACAVSTPRVAPGLHACLFEIGADNPRVAVRGDAVLARVQAGGGAGRVARDFSLADYKRSYGIFLHFMPAAGAPAATGGTLSVGMAVPEDTDVNLLGDLVKELHAASLGPARR